MIRCISPATIANSIIGVQPMTGPVGSIFSMRYEFWKQPVKIITVRYEFKWNCLITTSDTESADSIINWLEENLDNTNYWYHRISNSNDLSVNFYNEEDIVAMKLKWEGYLSKED